MGTNYYYYEEGRFENEDGYDIICGCKPIHVCKVSGGWKTLVQSYRGGPITLDDWLLIMRAGHGKIMDEYGDILSFEKFKSITYDNNNWGGRDLLEHTHPNGGYTVYKDKNYDSTYQEFS